SYTPSLHDALPIFEFLRAVRNALLKSVASFQKFRVAPFDLSQHMVKIPAQLAKLTCSALRRPERVALRGSHAPRDIGQLQNGLGNDSAQPPGERIPASCTPEPSSR